MRGGCARARTRPPSSDACRPDRCRLRKNSSRPFGFQAGTPAPVDRHRLRSLPGPGTAARRPRTAPRRSTRTPASARPARTPASRSRGASGSAAPHGPSRSPTVTITMSSSPATPPAAGPSGVKDEGQNSPAHEHPRRSRAVGGLHRERAPAVFEPAEHERCRPVRTPGVRPRRLAVQRQRRERPATRGRRPRDRRSVRADIVTASRRPSGERRSVPA